eukprot:14241_1
MIADPFHNQWKLKKPINIINKPIYYSVWITSSNFIQNVSDLKYINKNKLTLACNDILSLSGYNCIKIWLAQNNLLNKNKCPFNKIIISGGHINSMKLVSNGIADIAAIDINVLLSVIRSKNKVNTHNFRILQDEILGPYHAPVIVVTKKFLISHKFSINQLQNIFVNAGKYDTKLKEYLKYK